MSPPTKLTLSLLSVWHVWVVRTAQHAPGLCPHYIKHNRLTLAGPIPCTTSTQAATTRSDPLLVFPPCRGTGENNPITLQQAQSWSNGDNIKTMSRPVTYLMDPGREGWRAGEMARRRSVREKGDGIGDCGVRGGVDMTARMRRLESLWWYPGALEQTVIQTTLINFSTLSSSPPPCHHTQACYIQEAVI